MFRYLTKILSLISIFAQAHASTFQHPDRELFVYLQERGIESTAEALEMPFRFYKKLYEQGYQLPEPSNMIWPIKLIFAQDFYPFLKTPEERLPELVYRDIANRILELPRREYFKPKVWDHLRTGRKWDVFNFLARMDFKLEQLGIDRPKTVRDALLMPLQFYDFELVKKDDRFTWDTLFLHTGTLPTNSFGQISLGLPPYPFAARETIALRLRTLHAQIIHVFSALDDAQDL